MPIKYGYVAIDNFNMNLYAIIKIIMTMQGLSLIWKCFWHIVLWVGELSYAKWGTVWSDVCQYFCEAGL